jgi:hypothetical protein
MLVARERLVDLERIHRQLVQVAQGRMAGAEIVNRDADAHLGGGPIAAVSGDAVGDTEPLLRSAANAERLWLAQFRELAGALSLRVE